MILPIGKGWSSLKKLTFIASVVNAWKTVTGAVANFIASKAKPVNVYFTLKPVQSGSGDPAPDNVRSISGHDSVTLKHSGVNVWDEEFEIGGIDTTTGANVGGDSTGRSKNYISVAPNTTYYRLASECSDSSVFITYFYDSDKQFISYTGSSNTNPSTFKTPAKAHYMRFVTKAVYGTTYNHDISINYPSTDTEYHAYNADSYTATFPSTVYGGVVDWSKEKVVSQMELIDLGDLNWINTLTDTTGHTRFYAVLPHEAVVSDTSHVNSVCSFLKLLSSGATYSCIQGHTIAYSSNEWRVYAYIEAYKEYTKQEFKTAVTGQKLVYTLKTPIEISISDADSIVPVIGENNIWVEEADEVTVQYL